MSGRTGRSKVQSPDHVGLRKAPDLRSLPPALRQALAAARRLARRQGQSLYLVGGAVRDLLLLRPTLDLDLVAEADAVGFGRRLARELDAGARVHERFGTTTLQLPGGVRLDVARARREAYERAGALPKVKPAPLNEDLERRDFTINAMALELAPGSRLVDPFGGRTDLEDGILRMLHARSPQDDPTRAFRAVRYANRLGFRVEARTRSWIAEAIERGAFDAVSGDRLRREIRLLFLEENRPRAVRMMGALGLDRVIDPALRHDVRVLDRLRRAEKISRRYPGKTGWLLYLIVWAASFETGEAERLARRLSMAGEEGRAFRSWPAAWKSFRANPSATTPSRVLRRQPSGDQIAAAAALLPRARGRQVERALEVLETRLSIRGRDLLAAGVSAGPEIGRALGVTLDALRDRKISRGEELTFAVRAAREKAS